MSQIRPLECPNCAARVNVPSGATRASCDYCGSRFSVQLDHGEAVLSSNQQIAAAIQGQGERTVEGLERLQLTQERAQLSQQVSTLLVHRDNLRSELRSLERMTQNRKTRKHIYEVQVRLEEIDGEIDGLHEELDEIDAILYPKKIDEFTLYSVPVATKPLPKWRRHLSGLLWAVIYLFVADLLFIVPIIAFNPHFFLLPLAFLLVLAAIPAGYYLGYYHERRRAITAKLRAIVTRNPE